VDAEGKEPELEPADDEARPVEKSGNPAVAAAEPCCLPDDGDGMEGILPADDVPDDDGMDGIEDELDDDELEDDELEDDLDDELDDELDDDGIEEDGIDDDGIDGDGILLDWEVCVVVSHALNSTAVRPMPTIKRCCDSFIFLNSACSWQDDDFAFIQNNILIRPILQSIIALQMPDFQCHHCHRRLHLRTLNRHWHHYCHRNYCSSGPDHRETGTASHLRRPGRIH
jgi:hypothetical protein